MDLVSMYLRNLAKRAMTDGKVYPAEVANAPRLIDKAYGNGDGHLDIDDVAEVVSNIVEKAGDVLDSIISIF